MRVNAGVVVWRICGNHLEVLLVHQAKKPNHRWSIPKGRVDAGETPKAAARREVQEESKVTVTDLELLGYAVYAKTRKQLHCFMSEAPAKSKPQSALPEIDCSQYVPFNIAMGMVDKRQRALLAMAEDYLEARRTAATA